MNKKFAIIFAMSIIVLGLIFAGCSQSQSGNQNQTQANSSAIANNSSGAVLNGSTPSALVAEKGDNVSVDYIGMLENGTVFDTSIKAEAEKVGLPARPSYAPLEFTAGAGQMIAGFDQGVIGMKVGENKTLTIQPEDAYGQPDPSKIVSVALSKIDNGDKLKVGDTLYTSQGAAGTVISISAGNVDVDFNSPLAGQTLIFEVTLENLTKGK